MPKAGFIATRASFFALAASILGPVMLAAPAAGSTCPSSGKCFAVVVSPPSPTAGASASFTFGITNEASNQQLGSVQITALAGFVITGAPGATSFTSSSALFLNLSLAPSATTTLTLSASALSSGAAYQWGIKAKQSNDFNGTGNDFQLDPASLGLTGSYSSCPSSTPCSASASSATTSVTVTTSSAFPGEFLEVGIVNYIYSCGGTYHPVSDPFSFALFGPGGVPQSTILNVSLEIDKSLVQSSGRTGASSWQICYASTSQFTAVPGTSGTAMIGGVTYHTGLLPDCSGTPVAPCVQARNKDNAGDVVVTFLAPGDPLGHG